MFSIRKGDNISVKVNKVHVFKMRDQKKNCLLLAPVDPPFSILLLVFLIYQSDKIYISILK